MKEIKNIQTLYILLYKYIFLNRNTERKKMYFNKQKVKKNSAGKKTQKSKIDMKNINRFVHDATNNTFIEKH